MSKCNVKLSIKAPELDVVPELDFLQRCIIIEVESLKSMSPASIPACTGCVKVLNDQQSVIQHQELPEHGCASVAPKQQKLCTTIENGRVVVRPIEPPQDSIRPTD